MPEIPDLNVFSSNLKKALNGKKLEKIKSGFTKNWKVSLPKLRKAIEKQKLTDIYRDGKQLRFKFENGNIMGLHLMLHGDLHLFKEKEEHKFLIIELQFEKGVGVAVTDWQGKASPSLNPEQSEVPDALSKELNYAYLKKVIQGSKAAIKNILTDQDLIRGLGNAYTDEILWEARISPFATGDKIPDTYIRKLARTIPSVLKNGEKQILKIDPHHITGELRQFLKVHNSKKTTSPTGAKILKKGTARKTYYTEEQERFE